MTDSPTDSPRSQTLAAAPVVLDVRDLHKSFGAIRALRGVSLELRRGEVLGLVGDNGAGKSTLVKCIAGVHPPDAGEIHVDGDLRHLDTPHAARDCGIETVYQDLSLIDPFDVVENFYLGREEHRPPTRLRLLNKRAMFKRTQETLDRLQIRIPSLKAPVATLSGGQRQAIAVARAVAWGRHIVVLDEPTAALGVEQTEQVLQLVERLAFEGIAVIVISHNMREVLRCTDRVVVMRQGSKVADRPSPSCSEHDLVTLITGGELRAV